MIIDKLDNLGKYKELNPLFADVVDFLKATILTQWSLASIQLRIRTCF